jgi:hypothetical protein
MVTHLKVFHGDSHTTAVDLEVRWQNMRSSKCVTCQGEVRRGVTRLCQGEVRRVKSRRQTAEMSTS